MSFCVIWRVSVQKLKEICTVQQILSRWVVGRSVGWSVGWLVGRLVGRLVGWLVGWLVDWSVGRSVSRLVVVSLFG